MLRISIILLGLSIFLSLILGDAVLVSVWFLHLEWLVLILLLQEESEIRKELCRNLIQKLEELTSFLETVMIILQVKKSRSSR